MVLKMEEHHCVHRLDERGQWKYADFILTKSQHLGLSVKADLSNEAIQIF